MFAVIAYLLPVRAWHRIGRWRWWLAGALWRRDAWELTGLLTLFGR